MYVGIIPQNSVRTYRKLTRTHRFLSEPTQTSNISKTLQKWPHNVHQSKNILETNIFLKLIGSHFKISKDVKNFPFTATLFHMKTPVQTYNKIFTRMFFQSHTMKETESFF